MPRSLNPRHGSLQVWPRVRAKRHYARIRHLAKFKEAKPFEFAGYKVGMTHIFITDNRQHSRTKGEEIRMPVTILECPPLKVASIRAYKRNAQGLFASSEAFVSVEKNLGRKVVVPKKQNSKLDEIGANLSGVEEIRIVVFTQPQFIGKAKRKPELFEMRLGGSVEEQFNFAKDKVGKEIRLQDIFKEGQQIDTYAVTKCHGFQGPVKRFGVTLRQHKSEKAIRAPANVGPWTGNRSWTVAHAGQTCFHQRMERNKWVVAIRDKPEELKVSGGFIRYGFPKATFMLLKGSVQGSSKRMIRFALSSRPNKIFPSQAPSVESISLHSQQGN